MIFDSDVDAIYGVTATRLNEQVKRNAEHCANVSPDSFGKVRFSCSEVKRPGCGQASTPLIANLARSLSDFPGRATYSFIAALPPCSSEPSLYQSLVIVPLRMMKAAMATSAPVPVATKSWLRVRTPMPSILYVPSVQVTA